MDSYFKQRGGFASYVGVEDESPCCSITDEFINFLRQRSQAVEAAAQIAADEGDEGELLDYVPEGILEAFGDVSILEFRGGDRNWPIFRPDPDRTRRPELTMIRATETASIADIRNEIYRTWPDLRRPGILWKLYDGNQAALNPIHIHEDFEILILHANTDTADNEVPILKGYQTWSLQQKRFDGILRPETMPGLVRCEGSGSCSRRKSTMHVIIVPLWQCLMDNRCNRGDYLVIMALESLEGMVGAIGHWTMFMQQDPVYTDAFPKDLSGSNGGRYGTLFGQMQKQCKRSAICAC